MANCCCCCCCCKNNQNSGGGTLNPVLVNYNNNLKTIDNTGSQGVYIRNVIKSGNGVIKETSAIEENTGDNQIAFATDLENGDIICTQVSNETTFSTGAFAETCYVIPTPMVGFVLP